MSYLQQSVERYTRSRGNFIPEMGGSVHAIYALRKPRLEPFFGGRFDDWRAVCGRKLRVVLALSWDEDRRNACPACVERVRAMQFGTTEPPYAQYL